MEKNRSTPTEKVPDWIFDNITAASTLGRRIYLAYIGSLIYVVVTALTVSDRKILLNESVTLPLLRVEIPFTAFLISAPILCSFLFLYYRLYAARIFGLMNQLKLEYIKQPKRRLYPWMFNIAQDPEPGLAGKLQKFIVEFSALPALILVFALLVVSASRARATLLQIYLVACPIILMLVDMLRPVVKRIRARKSTSPAPIKHPFVNLRTLKGLLAFVGEFLLFGYQFLTSVFVTDWPVPGFMRGHLDISYERVARKPVLEHEAQFWLYLRGKDLRYARFISADIRRTDFHKADLRKCIASRACLIGCQFTEANLDSAQLDEIFLDSANLSFSFIRNANLTGASLRYANLHGAILDNAILKDVDFRGAQGLTAEMLSRALTLHGAVLDSTLLSEITRDYPHLLQPVPDSATTPEP